MNAFHFFSGGGGGCYEIKRQNYTGTDSDRKKKQGAEETWIERQKIDDAEINH